VPSKKELIRSITLAVVPFLASLLIRFIYLTCRKKYSYNDTFPKEPTVVGFWHNDLIFTPFIYNKIRKAPKSVMLISDHFDGKLIAKTASYLKMTAIHGSSNRSAARVLIQAIKHIKLGFDVGITPDGPRGPRHEVADGIIIMAQKTNSKIILFSTKAESYWQLNSWDKFVIPKPFSKIEFVVSDALDIADMEFNAAKKFIQNEMIKNGT